MRRDERIADEAGADRALMRIARGCPCRWSIDSGNGRLCSAHAWTPKFEWPGITQQLLDAETEVALRNAAAIGQPGPRPLGRIEKQQLLYRLRAMRQGQVGLRPGKAWAQELREREERGENLTPAQRDAWRGALGIAVQKPELTLPDESGMPWDGAEHNTEPLAEMA